MTTFLFEMAAIVVHGLGILLFCASIIVVFCAVLAVLGASCNLIDKIAKWLSKRE